MAKKKREDHTNIGPPVSSFTYLAYLLFVVSFFLHLSARIPAIKALRPDLLLAVVVLMMLLIESAKLRNRLSGPCSQIMSVMLIYLVLSLPLVEWPVSVVRDNLSDFVKAVIFFYFTVLIVDTKGRMKFFISVFIICQVIRVLEPLYLNITTGYWGDHTWLRAGEFADRLSGAPSDIINPNGLGFVIATVFPYLHYLWGNATWKYKIGYISLVPPLLYALVLTMSRSGFIALTVVAWIIFLKSRHKFFLVIIALSACAVLWANMSDVQRDRYRSLTGTEDVQGAATAKGRFKGMIADLRVGANRPIVGHGLGTSKEAIYNIRGGSKVAHTLYFEVLIEMGMIGFIIYMLFLKSIFNMLKSISGLLSEFNDKELKYENDLLMTLNACFWMYIVFSLAQYGVSEYHWYLLAGITTVLWRNLHSGLGTDREKEQNKTLAIVNNGRNPVRSN